MDSTQAEGELDPIAYLNECLVGSPYSFDNSDEDRLKAQWLIDEIDRLEARHREAEEAFALESAVLRALIEQITEARYVYESNKLEMTGLPLDETRDVISDAPNELDQLAEHLAERAVSADRHLIDVLGLHQASLFARELASEYHRGVPLAEIDIRSLHAKTVPTERFGGRYRDVDVAIGGSDHLPYPPYEVPRAMAELVNWLSVTTAPPPLAAVVAHSWLAVIHPFEDGNGRVARLLANVILLRNGWPPLIIRASDRGQYLDALAASDEAGDILRLFDLCLKSIKRSLKELQKPDLATRLFEADLRKNPDQQFDYWSLGISDFLENLRETVTSRGFRLLRLSVPDISTFMLLREGDKNGNTWLAKVIHPDGRDFLLWLGFMSHEMRDLGSPSLPAPSIFVSTRNHDDARVHPYTSTHRDGSPIVIQEISLVPKPSEEPILVRSPGGVIDHYTIKKTVLRLAKELDEVGG